MPGPYTDHPENRPASLDTPVATLLVAQRADGKWRVCFRHTSPVREVCVAYGFDTSDAAERYARRSYPFADVLPPVPYAVPLIDLVETTAGTWHALARNDAELPPSRLSWSIDVGYRSAAEARASMRRAWPEAIIAEFTLDEIEAMVAGDLLDAMLGLTPTTPRPDDWTRDYAEHVRDVCWRRD